MSDLRPVHYAEVADSLRGKCNDVHQALGFCQPTALTATELATRMDWEITSVRPRLTQLKAAGLVEATGERRNHEHVFRFVSLAEAQRRAREREAAAAPQTAYQLPLSV